MAGIIFCSAGVFKLGLSGFTSLCSEDGVTGSESVPELDFGAVGYGLVEDGGTCTGLFGSGLTWLSVSEEIFEGEFSVG